jgi:hypothetical protein
MVQMLPLQQALRVQYRQMDPLAHCAQVMLDLKNVKHANKRFAHWSEIEEFRRKLC